MAAATRRSQKKNRSRTCRYVEDIFQEQRSMCGHFRAAAEWFVNHSGLQKMPNGKNWIVPVVCICLIGVMLQPVSGVERFPTPDFNTEYQIPSPVHPGARSDLLRYIDVLMLLAVLAAASYLALKKRSRQGLYMTAVFSVLYFGFIRKGCVCSVGSVQNVILSFFYSDYLLPLTALLFFVIPLASALYFGRTFCSSVCPLGALQEIVIFKPVKLPALLKHILGLFPYLYLGLAVLFAATNSGFIICKYDPFVGFFRLSAPYWIMIPGTLLLITGIFVARPYCRFICPYSVILGFFSFFSKRHLTITPDKCIQCRLCENSCPVDAIKAPTPEKYKTGKNAHSRTVALSLLSFPVLVLGLGWGSSQTASILAGRNKTVKLARQIFQEEKGITSGTTLDSDAFRESVMTVRDLYRQAESIHKKITTGLWCLGMFLGTVIFLKTTGLLMRHGRKDFKPDRFHCISCGRCMEYCPVKKEVQVKKVTQE